MPFKAKTVHGSRERVGIEISGCCPNIGLCRRQWFWGFRHRSNQENNPGHGLTSGCVVQKEHPATGWRSSDGRLPGPSQIKQAGLYPYCRTLGISASGYRCRGLLVDRRAHPAGCVFRFEAQQSAVV